MRRNAIETVMGAVVLVVAGLFIYFAATTTQLATVQGYPVTASFSGIGGLNVGSDVKISGVKIGTVTNRWLDPKTYAAIVSLTIDENVQIPVDTVAGISSEGPLGGKYVRLEPGTAATFITPGGMISKTRNYRSLEDQVGEIIFLATNRPSSGTPGGNGDHP